MSEQTTKDPLEALREAWGSGEFSALSLSREIGRPNSTVNDALNGKTSPGHKLVMEMVAGLERMKARDAADQRKEDERL